MGAEPVWKGWDEGGPQRNLHGSVYRQEHCGCRTGGAVYGLSAYAIGKAEPVAVDIDTHGTGEYADAGLARLSVLYST